jgi:hypothetical protein
MGIPGEVGLSIQDRPEQFDVAKDAFTPRFAIIIIIIIIVILILIIVHHGFWT